MNGEIDSHDRTKPTTFLCYCASQDFLSMYISSRKEHNKTPDKSRNITKRKLHDDPAFSSDPLVNPLFTTNGSLPPAWCSPPVSGHPTLQKQRQVVDGEEFYPLQPPNTPEPKAAADNRSQSRSPAETDDNDTVSFRRFSSPCACCSAPSRAEDATPYPAATLSITTNPFIRTRTARFLFSSTRISLLHGILSK